MCFYVKCIETTIEEAYFVELMDNTFGYLINSILKECLYFMIIAEILIGLKIQNVN